MFFLSYRWKSYDGSCTAHLPNELVIPPKTRHRLTFLASGNAFKISTKNLNYSSARLPLALGLAAVHVPLYLSTALGHNRPHTATPIPLSGSPLSTCNSSIHALGRDLVSRSCFRDIVDAAGTHGGKAALCNPEVGRRINVVGLTDIALHIPDAYHTFVSRLAQLGNLEASFIHGVNVVFRGPVITPLAILDENIERAAAGGHEVAAYVAAVLLYMTNGGTGVDATDRQYMRQAAMAVDNTWPRPVGEISTDLAIKIAGRLTATSERPMDNLRALRATCRRMLRVCGEPEVGRRVALGQFADDMSWDDPVGYPTLVGRLTKVGNPEACFLTWFEVLFRKGTPLAPVCTVGLQHDTEFGHNMAAYVAAIFLYRANYGAVSDDAARRYMRQVEGEEEAVAAAAAGRGDGGP
ncbi:hypothetical protein C2845_PM16G00080 [Panicum miliaceum]|uniref:Uncharacterized protein n=1 Tax=Panicum miliaceum TaxID=4540 RepID=A0A3L6Q0H8_PANMI|nr:hypothetical protein C2845_PM16G00080 [Panicum miliaceum]